MDSGIIFLLAAVIIIGVLLFVVMTLTKKGGALNVEKYRSRWMTIEQSIARDNEPSCHLAILNADKLLDQALRESGTKGQTMGDRMKFAKDRWSNRDAVWTAHKLRNKIAHEPDFQISYDTTRRALAAYKRGLKDIGAI